MQLANQLAALRRRWLIVAIFALLGVVVALGASLLATPQYTARSVVYFTISFGSSGSDLSAGSTYAQQQLDSYGELASTPDVLDPVIKQYALPESAKQLAAKVDATSTTGTSLLRIAVTDPSASRAATIANAVASSLGDRVGALSPKDASGRDTVGSTVVTKATKPSGASSPKTTRNVLAGLLGGLLLGIVAAFARDSVDSRVRTAPDLTDLAAAPVIAQIGRRPVRKAAPAMFFLSRDFIGMEGFRRLRSNLDAVAGRRNTLTVGVTSALEDEGKSTVVANLGQAFARNSKRVLLIDADLRQPALAELAGVDGTAGLTDVLSGDTDLRSVIHAWGDAGVDLLPAGPGRSNPGEKLGSSAMQRLLAEASEDYDVILLDTAPIEPVADTIALAYTLRDFVLVVRAGEVRAPQVGATITDLTQAGAQVLGMVLNGVPSGELGSRVEPAEVTPVADGTDVPQTPADTVSPGEERVSTGSNAAAAKSSDRAID